MAPLTIGYTHTHTHTHTPLISCSQQLCPCVWESWTPSREHSGSGSMSRALQYFPAGVCSLDCSHRLITPLLLLLSVGFPENKMLQFTGRSKSAQISRKPTHSFVLSYGSLQNVPTVSSLKNPQVRSMAPSDMLHSHCSIWVLDHRSNGKGFRWYLFSAQSCCLQILVI